MSADTLQKDPRTSGEDTVTRKHRPRTVSTVEPRAEFLETAEAFFLRVDLPGVKADDVEMQCENGRLEITAKPTPRRPEGRLLRREFDDVAYQRSFRLAEQVDSTRIEARLAEGVLEVTLPKSERAKSRRIEVTGN